MTPVDQDTLRTIITDALERTAFVIADPCDDGDEDALPTPTRHARIRYTGPEAGGLEVSATDGFLVELASSLLGVEPDEVRADAEGLDALRELANILGGSALLAIGSETKPYSLGLPEIIDAPSALPPAVACVLESEGETLRVAWFPGAARLAA